MSIVSYFIVEADIPKTVGTGTAARTYMERDTIGVPATSAADAIAKVMASCPNAVIDSVVRDSSVIYDVPVAEPMPYG